MTVCPQCGVANKNTANFCGNCGAALRPATSASPIPANPTPTTSEATAAGENAPRPWIVPPPVHTDQPPPSSPHGVDAQPKVSTPSTTPPLEPSRKKNLLVLSALLAVAGLVLIFVVAPEYTEFQRLIFNYGVRQYDPEYWMAMVGGGVCLLLSGAFLLKALTLPGEKS